MLRFIAVCVAGGFGTGMRYLVSLWAGKMFGATFPYGTLFVNLAGCFLIAAIVHTSLVTTHVSPTMRLVLTTGFMGGLTTYSSFNLETTMLLREGSSRLGAMNFGVTVVGCFVAGMLGLWVARAAFGN